jgi:hypothetical protein
MEIRLSDNSRLRLRWSEDRRALNLQLWQVAWARDGHGFMFVGETVLVGKELHQFLDVVNRSTEGGIGECDSRP